MRCTPKGGWLAREHTPILEDQTTLNAGMVMDSGASLPPGRLVCKGESRCLPAALEGLARTNSWGQGEIIYQQDAPADYWYRVVVGAARKCAIMPDGRRHIVSFLLPDDLFGFGFSHAHQFTVEAITACTVVARYSRRRAEIVAESDPDVSRRVREAAFESISRLQARMVLLGRNSALEKVAAFLLEMRDRCGSPVDLVELPMSRYDIADYLSIAVETVSRSLTEIRRRQLIALIGTRRFRILDEASLLLIAGTDHDVCAHGSLP
jgi:CRP-like cAMP-binding protein